jgi:hypothetical protein
LKEDGLWYLDSRVVVPAGKARNRVLEEAPTHLTADISGNTKFCIRLIKTFGGLVGGRMLKVMCSVAWFVSVTKLRRLGKQGYCNRFLYRALSGKV